MNTKRISRCCYAEVEAIENLTLENVDRKSLSPDIYNPPPLFKFRCKKCGEWCDYDYIKTK